MKKTIIALAIAAVTLCGFSAAAQQRCCSKSDDTSIKNSDKMYRPQSFTDYAFEGILLDLNQQARVDSLNAAFAAKAPKHCPKACADSAANCKGKVCADKKVKASDKRMDAPFEARKEYIAKVKEILTPEQYTQFLENIANMPKPEKMRDGEHRHSGDKHMQKHDGKMQKHDGKMQKRDGKMQKQNKVEKKSK